MATATTNTPISHADDAGFRAWGSELSGMLADVGLVQTADTGQINWATVTKPASGAAAGYEVWRFADALQSTAPVFIKIEYGTGGNTSYAGVWVTVGSGTDGAGNITNIHIPRTQVSVSNIPTSTTTAYASYACHTDGALAVAFKVAMRTMQSAVGFVVTRPLDAAGAVSDAGIALVQIGWGSSSSLARCYGYAGAFDSGYSPYYSFAPYNPTSTAIGTQYQVFRCVGMFPEYLTLAGLWAGVTAEIGYGSAASVALEGTTARTYMPIQDNYGATNASGTSHAIIWE